MAQSRARMKVDEEPAELRPVHGHFLALAEPPGLDGGYLPSQDDQSWRELEALGITAAHDESAADITADQDGDPQEDVPESDSSGRGEGGFLFFMIAVGALATVALAFPGAADFWRAHWAAPATQSAGPPVRVAYAPAPPAQRPPPPAPVDGPDSNPGLNTEPSAPAMPQATPSPRPDLRGATDRGTMVIGQDGTVKYEDVPAVSKPVQAARDDRGAGGFYAKVPGPDGGLRYQYFPSRPSR